MTAAATYAAQVDAVLAQRTRLRGRQPSDDPRASLPLDHPLFKTDARRPVEPNLAIIASYVDPEDVIIDVGGGAGRLSLPLALRCREVINVDPSAVMLGGFEANTKRAGIRNARAIQADWLEVDPPVGSFALVNHVTYFTRDIVAFVEKLEVAVTRRILVTVSTPPPPCWNRDLFPHIYGETEEIVPGHVELVNVLWETGIEPDVRMLPDPPVRYPTAPTREAAVQAAIGRIGAEQWAHWPLESATEARIRHFVDVHFDDFFAEAPDGYVPGWIVPGREVLITWEARR